MIVLDTHVWVWWTMYPDPLTEAQRREIAKLCEYGRLELPVDLSDWFHAALRSPGVSLLELTPEIAVESVRLPGGFHRDPADQIIVATARVHGCPLVTSDAKIAAYPHVRTVL